MSTAKKYIEEIRNRQIRSDKEFILDSLTGAIDRLQKAFPRYGSFLMEFIQNADDSKSKSIKMEFLEKGIRIFNDGLAFSEEDVKSICKVGRSSKTPKDYIGYLGVGFKAVFLISESPEIYSGGFRFKFDKSSWDEPEHIPWQVIPVWIDKSGIELQESWTMFNLPIKVPELVIKLREEISPEHLNNRILLFLRNIQEIEIIDVINEFRRNIIKSKVSETPEYEVYQIQESENSNLNSSDLWAVFKSSVEVPTDVRNDYITKEWERKNVEKREILVAFKLDKDHHLVKEEKGTAHIGVFSFLPLKEIPSGLNFLIQADFLTTPGRGELARECLWNNWLAQEIYKMIIEKCIPSFLENDNWKMNFTNILYSMEGGHELFETYIKKRLNKYLETNSLLVAEDGTPAKPEELVQIGAEIKELLTEEDMNIVFLKKKIIHPNCKPHSSLDIEKAPSDIYNFLSSSKSEELLKQKAKSKDIEWFKKLYASLIDKYEWRSYFYPKHSQYNVAHDNFWNRMRDFYEPIILTQDYSLAKINESYTNPKKLKIPDSVKDRFKIVHSEIVKDEKFQQLQKRLNEERYHYNRPTTKVIGELTEADIKNAISKQEALELDEATWSKLPEKERIEKIKHIQELWNTARLPLEEYDFLTVKSKTGEWLKLEELIFPKEYKPEHNLEAIKEKELLDIPLKFLSEEFIQGENESKIREWGRFFKELGVDKKLAERNFIRNIIQRIGILVALKYEAAKGRSSRELSRSEETGGYDIAIIQEEADEETTGLIQSEDRFIEVKGRRQPNPDIFLTTKQFKTLKEKQGKYYVYVVKDCLRYPTLCTTRGDKLLEITDMKIIIPFSKWSNEAKDDEYQP